MSQGRRRSRGLGLACIADYVAVAVAYEHLAGAERERLEARVRGERLDARVKSLAEDIDVKSGLGRVIGQSARWKDVLKRATQVAATEATVLLQGESGTGKEVVARFIHAASGRKGRPFVSDQLRGLAREPP